MRLNHLFALGALLLPSMAVRVPAPAANNVARDPRKFQQHNKPAPDTKYFHEPQGNEELGHYDIRYFTGNTVNYDQRRNTLLNLVRSYLEIFREKNIETWIAHGTLLGWWWNGKIMPWDWDLDTQVSASTLTWLGENLNMTYHNYNATNDDGSIGERRYLLDVNPNHVSRVRGDGQNVIDARWIDVRNGLYIDITGLAEVNPSTQPGVWSCKNFHRYRTRDLYPMRETVFEGVPALVPYSFDRILTEEYGTKALTKTQHEGHQWIPEQKEWVKQTFDHPSRREARPHVPRSLQAEEEPRSGLSNLLKVL